MGPASPFTLTDLTMQSPRTSGGESTWNRRMSLLPSLGFKKNSDIEIVLDGPKEFIRSYSTFDQITGHVNLKFDKDTCIDDFAITFQGMSRTYVEKVASASPTTGRTSGKHTFMRIQQPIDTTCLPELNRALAGQTYTIPFQFVVPDRILDFVCNHKVDSDHVKSCHLELPPSTGDPMLSGQGNTLMDDLAPSMSKVSYSIRVGLIKACPNLRKAGIIEEGVGIRVIPASEELPPLSFEHVTKRFQGKYRLRKEKAVRRGIFKIGKKQGTLTAESFQPASFKLPHPSESSIEPVSTMVVVNMRYDPASIDEQPPSLNDATNRLKAYTFFGAAPWSYLPAPDGYDIYSIVHSQYPHSIDLPTHNLSKVEWAKHEPGTTPVATSVPFPNARETRTNRSDAISNPTGCSAGVSGSRPTADRGTTRRASTFSNTSSNSSTSTNESDNCSSSHSDVSSDQGPTLKTSIASPSTSYDSSLPYYTTSIIIPITLPTPSSPAPPSSSSTTSPTESRRPSLASPIQSRRPSMAAAAVASFASSSISKSRPMRPHTKQINWLPTFHSCLISRIYSLEVDLHTAGAPTIHLRMPVQLSLPCTTAPPETPDTRLPSFFDPFATDAEEAIAQALDSAAVTDTPTDEVPRYEDAYEDMMRHNHTSAGRTMSTPVTSLPMPSPMSMPQATPEAPPEYFSAVRQMSAARRVTAINTAPRRSSTTNTTTGTSTSTNTGTTNINPNPNSTPQGRRSSLISGSRSTRPDRPRFSLLP